MDNVIAASRSSQKLTLDKAEEIASRLIRKAQDSGEVVSEKIELTSSESPTPFTHPMKVNADDQAWVIAHEFTQQTDGKYVKPLSKWLEYLKRSAEAGHALVYTRADDPIEAKVKKMQDLSRAITNSTGIEDFPVVDVRTKIEVRQSSRTEDIVSRWSH